jgi:WD40 repeat protein
MNVGERFCGKCGASLDVSVITDDRIERAESQPHIPVAKAAPRWRLWILIAGGLLVLAILLVAGLRVLGPTEGGIDFVAVSPDGRLIAEASHSGDDRLLKLRDMQTEKVKLTLTMQSFIEAVAFLPDSRTVAVGTYQEISLWDAQTGAENRRMKVDESVDAIVITPDGRMKAVGHVIATDQGYNPVLYDLQSGQSKKLARHSKDLAKFTFSPDGNTLASVGQDETPTRSSTLRLWDAQTGELKHALVGPASHTLGAHSAFSPDSNTVAALDVGRSNKAADEQVNVLFWDVQTGAQKGTLRVSLKNIFALSPLAFSPDGKRIAIAAAGNGIGVWDVTSGTLLRTLTGDLDFAQRLAFSPDGRRLVSAGFTSRLFGGSRDLMKVWDIETGK